MNKEAITPRANAILALEHKVPERIVEYFSDCNALATFIQHDRAGVTPENHCGGDGVDWFGNHWKYEPTAHGPMIDPAYPPVMTDITKWREQVKFPDLSQYDFKGEAEKELNSPNYDPDKLNMVTILSGPFERLLCLMGCEEALCSMLEEPEACLEFFHAMADHKIELIDRLAEAYPIDIIDVHDDWGTSLDSFMSVETWKQLLAGPTARIHNHGKSKGFFMQQHSCGKIERLVPSMLEIGIDHWSSAQAINDIPRLVHEYGDRLTFYGCFDIPEARRADMTQEELDAIVAERMDNICRGGCVFPAGDPGMLGTSLRRALDARADFFTKPENRVLP